MSDSETVSLEKFIIQIMDERQQKIAAVLDERQKQLEQTAKNLEIRLAHLNELHKQVMEDRTMYLRSETCDARYGPITKEIEALKLWQANVAGKTFMLLLAAGIFGGSVGAWIASVWK